MPATGSTIFPWSNRAKDAGRGNFQFYAREMNARTLDRLKIEVGLRHALNRGEFVLHYQPQVDIESGRVAGVLEETGCPPACLELEITESVVMENPEAAAGMLHKLSDMGVRLAIDDFGAGYSSLNYLKRFPINKLKIDRSFVTDITTDPDDAAIAKAVIALAHSMKLEVTAEGVETAEQLAFLRGQRCDQLQGYYFSKPVPPARFTRFL
jgi:EAL domain-containing protein (putative c-di-GMP-specific phosphodiesterase class I)